ncbi:hypothetical protein COCOBI_11-3510 [Coccomyxa sp. Obi]|nr:hypothetical protein COCOBI_11-3510 [Coccomyxa sp. Obi]
MIRSDSDPSLPPKIYGSVEFEAEALVEASRSANAGDNRDPETTLKLVGGMKREDYAVGVFVLALGLGAASSVTQAITTAGQKGAQILGQAASVLDEQQKTSAERAKLWLSGLMQQSEKQATTAQESLEEWPHVLQQSYSGAVENHRRAVHQAQTNLQHWAKEYVPGSADVQRLWRTAAEAAQQHLSEWSRAERAPRDGRTTAADGPGNQPSSSEASGAGPTAASASTEQMHLPGESAGPGMRRRSETEVYAAESQASARAAEAQWNERIRNAYASVAAGTPFRPSLSKASPAETKPASHALSYARGGNTTLLRPDFVPPSSGGRSPSGSGSGDGISSGRGGGSGGGGSGSGGDDDAGDEQRPERPHGFLWGRLLLLAGAAVAAAEQLLERPGRGSRLPAALALLGAVLWQGQRMQRKRQGRRMRRSERGSFSLGGAGQTNRVAAASDDLSDMSSDEEGF